MYADRSRIEKCGIVSPVIISVSINLGFQVIFFKQVTLNYWELSFEFDIMMTFLFYITANLSLSSLLSCTCTNPGDVSKDWAATNISHAIFDNTKEKMKFKKDNPSIVLDIESYPKYQYCDICKIVIPPKTIHCDDCNKCTLCLDHHCPWIGNCIGFKNLKFFVLFCLYGGSSSLILGFILLPQLYKMLSIGENLEFVFLSNILVCFVNINIRRVYWNCNWYNSISYVPNSNVYNCL